MEAFRETHYPKTEHQLSQAEADDIAWNYIQRQESQIQEPKAMKGIINSIIISSFFWIVVILLIQLVRP